MNQACVLFCRVVACVRLTSRRRFCSSNVESSCLFLLSVFFYNYFSLSLSFLLSLPFYVFLLHLLSHLLSPILCLSFTSSVSFMHFSSPAILPLFCVFAFLMHLFCLFSPDGSFLFSLSHPIYTLFACIVRLFLAAITDEGQDGPKRFNPKEWCCCLIHGGGSFGHM